MILNREFYQKDALEVAKGLLGKTLVREINGVILRGKIVETEAYIGSIDKASHAYNGKRTQRTEPLFKEGGCAYVYFIYGLYNCFNVVSGNKDDAQGVLIRALEPLDNFEYISLKRFNKGYEELSSDKKKDLTNGPSKLCMAFDINNDDNYAVLYEKGELYIEDNFEEHEIVETTRIGINYAEEAIDFPWRFYIKDNEYVSKK